MLFLVTGGLPRETAVEALKRIAASSSAEGGRKVSLPSPTSGSYWVEITHPREAALLREFLRSAGVDFEERDALPDGRTSLTPAKAAAPRVTLPGVAVIDVTELLRQLGIPTVPGAPGGQSRPKGPFV